MSAIAPRISLVLDRLRVVDRLIPRDAAEALDELGYALLELEELLDELGYALLELEELLDELRADPR